MSADPDELERLVRIETKLDMALTQQADHETRIRTLERWRWLLVGAAAIGGGGVSQLLQHLT